MSIQDQLNNDMKVAMKAQDKTKLSVIRMILSSIRNAEIEKKAPLTDDQVLDILVREQKQRKDSLVEFTKGNREDLATKEAAEIEIIEEYLPEQLTEAEVREIVAAIISEVGATTKADIGKVMGQVMPAVKGRADGKTINRIVQEFIL